MSHALDPAAYIFEGIWTDWTKGSVGGLTLTLCPTQATLLTNSLALFVTLAGGQLWTIFRFALHQFCTSPQPGKSDADHSRRQVVLRNAATAPATARLMLTLAWASQRSGRRPPSRSMFIIFLAVTHAAMFMVAGTLSNKVASTGAAGLVLSRSNYCGVWNETYFDIAASQGNNPSSAETLAMSVQYLSKLYLNTQLSLEYAQECYMFQPSYYMSSTCNTLKSSSLKWTNRTGTCPFERQLCHANSETIILDTGLIDSRDGLGINSRDDERLQYRRLTTCAVLNDTDHIKGWDGSVNRLGDSLSPETAYAYYGTELGKHTNWTYSYSNFASFYTNFTSGTTIPYQVKSQFANPISMTSNEGTFAPIPELEQKTADLILLFLSFTGEYLEEVDDPWFSAHRPRLYDSKFSILQKRFRRDTAISTLGCIEQHQFCTSSDNCTPFLGFYQVREVDSFNSALTPHQNVTFDRMLRAVGASSIRRVVSDLSFSSTPLLAVNATATGSTVLSLHLPDNQWQIELKYWHSIAMAQLQRTIVQWGTGQIAPDPEQQLIDPRTEPDSWFCDNLMIPSTVYQSFSLVAIILIIVFGTLTILISWTVEDVAGWAQRRFNRSSARQDWDYDDMLQLKPQPPPKDCGNRSTSLPSTANETITLETVPPILYSHRSHRYNVDGWARSPSSEALPLEDRILPFVGNQPNPRGLRTHIWPDHHLKPDRGSWVAISLDGATPAIPMSTLDQEQSMTATKPTRDLGPTYNRKTHTIPRNYDTATTPSSWI